MAEKRCEKIFLVLGVFVLGSCSQDTQNYVLSDTLSVTPDSCTLTATPSPPTQNTGKIVFAFHKFATASTAPGALITTYDLQDEVISKVFINLENQKQTMIQENLAPVIIEDESQQKTNAREAMLLQQLCRPLSPGAPDK